jgi:hypothetical protein
MQIGPRNRWLDFQSGTKVLQELRICKQKQMFGSACAYANIVIRLLQELPAGAKRLA